MADTPQARFCLSIEKRFPEYFAECLIFDIGDPAANSSNQFIFKDCLYLGVAFASRQYTDIFSAEHKSSFPDASIDVIVAAGCFEHDRSYARAMQNAVRLLKPGGLFLLSCAQADRQNVVPPQAPGDGESYYKNLDEAEIRKTIDVDSIFAEHEFSADPETHDLHFWGRKKGVYASGNYPFQTVQPLLQALRNTQILALNQAMGEREAHISELKAENIALTKRITMIYRSNSWRITAPLRRGAQSARAIMAAPHTRMAFGFFLLVRSVYVIRHYGLRDFMARASRFLRGWWQRKMAMLRFRHTLSQLGAAANKRKAEPVPLISYIIPVHNRTDMLRTAIQSVLKQTFQNLEVILVTNASPPETIAVLDEFRNDSRVRIFDYYRNNTGNAVRGRNKGILEARGEFIAFLDSDDIATPKRAELSLPLLVSGQADVVYGAWQALIDGTRKIDGLSDGQVVCSPDCDLTMLHGSCVPHQSAVMLRKKLFETAGFLKPRMEYREDHELFLRLARHGAVFKSIPYVLTRIRLHDGNTELNFKNNDGHWEKMMQAEYEKPGPHPKKIAFIMAGVGINGGIAVIFRHIMMLIAAGHDAFIINFGDMADHGDWFTGNTAPIVHISDKRAYLFDNIDLLFATGWMTVEWLSRFKARRKLYFVQADERQFVEEASLKERIRQEYQTPCEYMTEALWIQKMLRTEFGHESAYVPNGLDLKVFYPDTPIKPKNPNRLRVLIEGPICIPRKGMDDAYAAIESLDCEIWIVSSVGKPKPGWRYDRFFEGVPFGDMRKMYSSCDIFLKMSRAEGFYGPPMEAMACGCSVVTGKVSGYEEYIVDGENALVVEQGDVEGAKQAVRRLMNDDALRNKLIRNGFETVKFWTWERSAQAMLALVEKEPGNVTAFPQMPAGGDEGENNNPAQTDVAA